MHGIILLDLNKRHKITKLALLCSVFDQFDFWILVLEERMICYIQFLSFAFFSDRSHTTIAKHLNSKSSLIIVIISLYYSTLYCHTPHMPYAVQYAALCAILIY